MDEPPEESLVPVDIIKKLDSLENPPKPPIVMYKRSNHWDKLKKGLEPVDQEIVERLRKLKEKEDKALTVDQIKMRLALLKDEDPDASSSNHKINIHEVDTRTEEQKVNDLMQEYMHLKLVTEGDTDVPEDHLQEDVDHIAKMLVARARIEAELEKKYKKDTPEAEEMELERPPKDSDDEEDDEDSDEWARACVICSKTQKTAACSCCDGNYYCPACYAEIHTD